MGTRMHSYRWETGLTVELQVMDCATCGVVYGISGALSDRRRADGDNWYCPNGHSQVYAKSTASKEKERADSLAQQLRWAESREAAQRREREAAERSAAAYRGHLTRLRNRIANGVCPVQKCRRNFIDVHRHITTQHPEWAAEHPDVFA